MSNHALATRPAPRSDCVPRRRQLLDTGSVDDGVIDACTARTAGSAAARFGLAPAGRTPGAPHASAAQLARALDHQHELVSHARPVMEFLFEQTRDTDSMVILADAQGMLLQSLGDASFLDRARTRGAASRRQLARTMARHQRDRHRAGRCHRGGGACRASTSSNATRFLTCAAAPIADPRRPRARRAGHLGRPPRLPPPHAGAGALGGAHDREPAVPDPPRRRPAAAPARPARGHRHGDRRPAGAVRRRLDHRRQRDGARAAGPARERPSGATARRVLQLDIARSQAWAAATAGSAPHPVRRARRQRAVAARRGWIRCRCAAWPQRRPAAPAAAARPHEAVDALAALDTGDPAMQAAVGARAARARQADRAAAARRDGHRQGGVRARRAPPAARAASGRSSRSTARRCPRR